MTNRGKIGFKLTQAQAGQVFLLKNYNSTVNLYSFISNNNNNNNNNATNAL